MLYIIYDIKNVSFPSFFGNLPPREAKVVNLIFSKQSDKYVRSTDLATVLPFTNIFYQIPAAERSYDSILGIWTIPAQKLDVILNFLGLTAKIKVKSVLVPDILTFIQPKKEDQEKPPTVEDFFYQNNTTGTGTSTGTLSLVSLEKELCSLLQISDTAQISRKAYLKAAKRLHPDVNNGDSSLMAELNYIWQEYTKLKGAVNAISS